MLCVKTFVNMPVTSNCYVLFDKEESSDCIIIDPGSKSEADLIEVIDREGLHPLYIILTHEHFDHCWGVNELILRFHIPIICSQLCAEAIRNVKRNCSFFNDSKEAFVINSETVSTESIGNIFSLGDHRIKFINTPGHTDASICFAIDTFLFTGDTLIKNEITVTKLPTGSEKKLRESMSILSNMIGKGYCVFPGHGVSFSLDSYDINLCVR